MKMTLLAIVQNILSAMDAEEVSSIGDTIESMQIAEEVKTAYYENFGNFELHSRMGIVQLDALTDSTDRPNVLKIPENVDQIDILKYNKGTTLEPEYYDVCFLEPQEFLLQVLRPTSGTATLVKMPGTHAVPYTIFSDAHPTYYTTIDNEHVIFDSYNVSVDSTLQNSKTLVSAEVLPSWSAVDTFTPDLESRFFPWLLSEAKSVSFINYKGVSSAKEEQRSRRQAVKHQNNRHRNKANRSTTTFNYGR